jgi:hypothetical protein
MATAACERCGKQVDDSKLLFSDVGRVCGTCELALGEAEGDANLRWTTAVAGPLMAFCAAVVLAAALFPVIGVIASGVAPFLSLLAMGLGVRAFFASGDADGVERTLLVVCGGLAVPAGAVLFGVSGLFVLYQIRQLAGGLL